MLFETLVYVRNALEFGLFHRLTPNPRDPTSIWSKIQSDQKLNLTKLDQSNIIHMIKTGFYRKSQFAKTGSKSAKNPLKLTQNRIKPYNIHLIVSLSVVVSQPTDWMSRAQTKTPLKKSPGNIISKTFDIIPNTRTHKKPKLGFSGTKVVQTKTYQPQVVLRESDLTWLARGSESGIRDCTSENVRDMTKDIVGEHREGMGDDEMGSWRAMTASKKAGGAERFTLVVAEYFNWSIDAQNNSNVLKTGSITEPVVLLVQWFNWFNRSDRSKKPDDSLPWYFTSKWLSPHFRASKWMNQEDRSNRKGKENLTQNRKIDDFEEVKGGTGGGSVAGEDRGDGVTGGGMQIGVDRRAVQMRTIIGGGNGGTNLGHLFQFAADQYLTPERCCLPNIYVVSNENNY
ncbi:hypothetical protein LXL04_006710 [Taraxacum kok-saghyz]